MARLKTILTALAAILVLAGLVVLDGTMDGLALLARFFCVTSVSVFMIASLFGLAARLRA